MVTYGWLAVYVYHGNPCLCPKTKQDLLTNRQFKVLENVANQQVCSDDQFIQRF